MSAAFNREWKACTAIASQAFIQRVRLGNNWLSWALLAMAALIAAGVGFTTGEWRKAIGFGFGLPLSLLAWLWWFFIVDAVRKQNHAAAFKLVPRMATRSKQVLFAVWVIMSLLVGLVMSLPMNNPVISTLSVGLFLAITAAMIEWQVSVGVTVLVVAAYLARKLGYAMEFWAGFAMNSYLMAALCAAVLLASGWAIGWGLGQPQPVRLRTLKLSPAPLYASSLSAACEGGDRTRLLMHVLGPAADSRTQAILLAVALATGAVAMLAIGVPPAVQRVFFVAAALAVQFGVADRLSAQMYARHREQSLLRLAVRAPASGEVNAVLARALMRKFVGWWLASTAAAMALAVLGSDGEVKPLPLFAVFCMPLMAAGTLLHGYAPRPHFRMRSKVTVVAWFLFTYAVYFMSMIDRLEPLAWYAIALVALGSAFSFAWYRLREMRRAPCSFPAGRSA